MNYRLPDSTTAARTRTVTPTRVGLGRCLVAILALVVVAAGCSDGSDPVDGVIATDDQSTDGQASDDQTTSSEDGGSFSSDDPSDDGAQSDEDDGGETDGNAAPSDQPTIRGACSTDNMNSEAFYAVTNIADDDPDGGLNVRDNYEGGEKLATLVEGTVVYIEDCYQLEDGTAWFAIQTADDVNGWVNASFLTPRISPLEPTFGGDETAAMVEAVLNALAAKRWQVAADELTSAEFEFLPLASLLGEPAAGPAPVADEDAEQEDGPDLADQLRAYCDVRICDAPYSIVDIRGSYVPSRVSPEIDVNFTYSGGIVTETFGRVTGPDEGFTLDTLPGQSILAFNRTLPTVAQVATNADDAPAGLLEAAEAVRRGLLAESGPGIPDDYVPDEGVVISSNAFVAEEGTDRQIVTAQDLIAGRDEDRLWGYTDGVGRPIVQTVDEWFAGYRRNIALLEPDEIAVDERVGLSNTIDNLAASFAEAATVEFHRAGREFLSDFNWSSVRLALELRDREWKVVAITLDTWTI